MVCKTNIIDYTKPERQKIFYEKRQKKQIDIIYKFKK